MKRVGLGVALAGAAFALAATPAQAAEIVRYNPPEQCDTYNDPPYGATTVCFKNSGQYKYTDSSSGNVSYQGKETTSYTLSNAYLSYSDSFANKMHILLKKGEPQVAHQTSREVNTVDGITCTFTQNYTFANGEIRHDKATGRCSGSSTTAAR